MNQCSPTFLVSFNNLGPTVLMAHELTRNRLELKLSSIPNAVDCVFTTVQIDANQVIG